MPHQVSATGAAAEVPHMPTNSVEASGTFLKNRQIQTKVKITTICSLG